MLLEGKPVALKIKEQIKLAVAEMKACHGQGPKLATLLIGDDAGAMLYARSQQKVAETLGIAYSLIHMARETTQEAALEALGRLNQDASITGIILQMPLPPHLASDVLIAAIAPQKDVEGITPSNLGLLLMGKARLFPCTPKAALTLIESTGIELEGLNATVVGASAIVGKPMALMLAEKSMTVTLARSAAFRKGTLEADVRRADILVVAIGKPRAIPGEWVKDGAVVIDIGINDVAGKVVGDIAFEQASQKAAFITPVPGGVGPLTVTLLMQNVLRAYEWQHS